MITLNADFKDISHKVTKIGKLGKAQRAVKNRQKLEATENQIVFRIDRADKQRNTRREKRKNYKY